MGEVIPDVPTSSGIRAPCAEKVLADALTRRPVTVGE
jgi:hypothetical protein